MEIGVKLIVSVGKRFVLVGSLGAQQMYLVTLVVLHS
jgi:hypothetical protein